MMMVLVVCTDPLNENYNQIVDLQMKFIKWYCEDNNMYVFF